MTYNVKLFEEFPTEDDLLDIIRQTSTTVWKRELVIKDIEAWLDNFKGELFSLSHERIIGLWLLSHFTFYNEDEVKHLCRVVYRDLIHYISLNFKSKTESLDDFLISFFQKSNIISSEQISGSGGFIAYFFRQVNGLPIKDLFNFSISNISDKIENILVIDDVTLSSGKKSQMYKFWQDAKLKYPKKKLFLLTLLSSEESCKFLKKEFDIEVINAITLDNRDKCFHKQSDVFSAINKEEITVLCQQFADHYGRKIGIVEALGFGNGQYTFGFFYNTPDNTLPIFWGQVNGWIPVLRRYHKNYFGQNYLLDERFI